MIQSASLLDTANHPFLQWLFKTRMSFYNNAELQLQFFYFGLCCWNYCIAGIVMIWTKPKYIPPWFPYDTFAYVLIFIQSPLSYIADYLYMTHDSYWHIIDRIFAFPGMILECVKYIIMIYVSVKYPKQQNRYTCFVYGLNLCGALYCYSKSQQAQNNIDVHGFCFWHTAWHMYPIINSCVILLNYYVVSSDSINIRKRLIIDVNVIMNEISHKFSSYDNSSNSTGVFTTGTKNQTGICRILNGNNINDARHRQQQRHEDPNKPCPNSVHQRWWSTMYDYVNDFNKENKTMNHFNYAPIYIISCCFVILLAIVTNQ